MSQPTKTTGERSGYLELVRTNPHYRRFWMGEIASNLGDWFNTIAIYTLVERLTGSPLALGLVFVTKSLPFALASPLAGLVVDRFDRRRLMIAADIARAAVVLGLLLVERSEHVPLIYLLGALQMVFAALFIPARTASIPNITTPRELLTANALSAATWSTLLAVGAALGGIVTEWIGERGVFVIDSATYLVSAWLIFRTKIPQEVEEAEPGPLVRTAVRDVVRGWRLMWDEPRIGRMALAKPIWALGGGALVYTLALLGERISPETPALGIGWLYAARGLGSGMGPIATRRWFPDSSSWPRMMGLWVAASGTCYLLVSFVDWRAATVLVLVVMAHTTSGANWVASTVLLQERTEDRYRGRVFATQWLILTLADSVAIITAAVLLESGTVDLRGAIGFFAGVQILSGLAWLAIVAPKERREAQLGKEP